MDSETRAAVRRQLREKLRADWGWVGLDLDSQTKYRLRLAKETGLTLAEIEEDIRTVQAGAE